MSSKNIHDYCIYGDTDSVYYSSIPLMPSGLSDEEKQQFTIDIARSIEVELNAFYDVFSERAFNCTSHKFHIKGESVASTGFWVAKKRYALDKVYDLETNQAVQKMVVKGLDVVRSSFPKAFREFMTELLKDILKGATKESIDRKILDFKHSLKDRHYLDVARNTSANNISEYGFMEHTGINQFKKGTPAHIKAALVYNRLLTYYKIDTRHEKITDGAKIKYVYLKDNPLQIDGVAVKGYDDPQQVIDLVTQYIDTDALFENELRNKLDDFYTALKWGNIPTEVNQNAAEFFAF